MTTRRARAERITRDDGTSLGSGWGNPHIVAAHLGTREGVALRFEPTKPGSEGGEDGLVASWQRQPLGRFASLGCTVFRRPLD